MELAKSSPYPKLFSKLCLKTRPILVVIAWTIFVEAALAQGNECAQVKCHVLLFSRVMKSVD